MINQLFSIINLIAASLFDWCYLFQQRAVSLKVLVEVLSNSLIGKNQSQLMLGLIFGAKNSLNSSLHRSFKVIGMLHIWSASGFNVTLFLSSIVFLLNIVSYCSYKLKTILLLLSVLFFWYISGQGPAMQRAVLMTGLSLLIRRLFFKQLKPLYSLLLAISLIIALEPNLINSLSLKFSAAATAGIIVLQSFFSSLIRNGFNNKSFFSSRHVQTKRQSLFFKAATVMLRYFCKNFTLFFSVQIALLPLISSTWGELSLLAVLSNSLLSGVLPILVILGLVWFAWCIFTWLLMNIQLFNIVPFSRVVGLLLALPLNLFLAASQFFAQLEAAVVKIPEFSDTQIYLWYLAWGLLGWQHYRRKVKAKIKPLAIKVFSGRCLY